jgi:phospholipid/cholesterol/gamma-HCH transport system ATP-binding protein
MAEPAKREAIIEVRGVVNRFGPQVVHDGLDLDVYRGEVLGIVGGSGTGKSVLLRSIVGLNRPAAGSVRVFGVDVLNTTDAEREAVSRRWGVLFQQGALFSALTVQQNVEAPMRELLHVPKALREALAELKIAMVGLPAIACGKYPSELSGGMQKRAGLARALALDPDIVFLDEPTAGLDPIGAAAFDDLIRQLKESLGLTVFMVTHDLDSLHAICDRIAVLAEKKVLVTGTMAEMLEVEHPWVREYFHGPRARAAIAATD